MSTTQFSLNYVDFVERFNIPKSWEKIFEKSIKDPLFAESIHALFAELEWQHIFNVEDCFLPFHQIDPDDVKVIMMIEEPITDVTSPYPLINAFTGKLPDELMLLILNNMYLFERQILRKFKGSTFLKLRDTVLKNYDEGKNTSKDKLKMYERQSGYFNYDKVIRAPAFDTQNWYKQGVLVVNPYMVGPTMTLPTLRYFRILFTGLLRNIQDPGDPIVLATNSSEIEKYYSSYIKYHSRIVFNKDLLRLLLDINEALEELLGNPHIIDFLC